MPRTPRRAGPMARRWLRRLAWAGAALLALWALGWLGLPPLIQWQGEKIASERLGRPVRIGAVDFKPWTMELTLRDLAVGGAPGAAHDLLKVKRLYADAELQSVWRLAPVIDALQIDEPEIHLTHLGAGRYDVDDILARLAARPQPAEPAEPARFALYNIDLRGGRLDFDDRVVGRVHAVHELRLALPFISNLPAERRIKVQPQLAFALNGSAFDSRAQALPFDDSRQTDAAFKLSQLDLKPYLGYIPAGLPLQLQAATLDADLRLGFEQAPRPSLRIGGTLAVTGLKAVDGEGADALAFDALKLQLGEVRPLERQLQLASVELDGPQLTLRRLKDGRFNLLMPPADHEATKLIAENATSTSAGAVLNAKKEAASTASNALAAASGSAASRSASARAAAPPPWQVQIDKLTLRGGTLDFSDDTTAQGEVPAAVLRLNELELAAAQLSWPQAAPASFSGSAALVGAEGLTPALLDVASARRAVPARHAATRTKPPATVPLAAASAARASDAVPSIEFQGQAGAQGAELNARVAAVPLALAGPYLAPYLVPRLTGHLDAHFGVQWAPPKARDLPPELKIAVEHLALGQLMLADGAASEPATGKVVPAKKGARASTAETSAGALASVGQIELQKLLLDWRTRAVSVGKLVVQAPRALVARDADQRWMFQDWLRQPADGATTKAGDAPAVAKPAKGGPATDFPWRLSLAELAVEGGAIGWRDAAAPGRPVELDLSQLQIEAKQFELNGKQPMPLNVSARVGAGEVEPGRLGWRGTLGLAPLAAQGTVDAQRLPVHALEPYFGDLLNIDILRADASFKGNLGFTQTAQGPRLRVAGDAALEELRTHIRPGTAVGDTPPGGASAAVAKAAAAPVATARGTSRAALAPAVAGAGRRPADLGEELASWKLLRLSGLDVQLEPGKPPQLDVKDALLSDFYARLIIHPNGRLNLQDVVKSKDGRAAAAPVAPPPPRSAPTGGMPAAGEFNAAGEGGAPAPAPVAAAPTAPPDPMAPLIRVGPLKLAGGRIFFSDRFIRPNYSADLTELNGALGAFSSVSPAGAPQMADLQLTGRAEGTAALDVKGKLNPLAKPLALDIHANVSDLDLPPLTPYSVKYAGHGIERGKLSMEVAYVVTPDGRLTADNKLVLNQLEFGEPVAGAPASLPVKLATALLADSKGVIDLDLPISGSLNDPQFSIGPIIFKAIVNLIGKAITAPFTLLARSLGGSSGEDMSNIAFAPGSAQLDAKARNQLDKIAKALAERPQLKLTVVGTANLGAEREGLQRERLKAMVLAERRDAAGVAPAGAASVPADAASAPVLVASGDTSTSAGSPSGTKNLSEAEYAELLRRLYRRADIPGKPRNAIGMLRDIPVPEMETLLLAHIEVGDDAMRQLAVQRGAAVKDYLSSQKMPTDRLFVGQPRTGAAALAAPAAAAASASRAASEAGATGAASAVLGAQEKWSPRAELALAAK